MSAVLASSLERKKLHPVAASSGCILVQIWKVTEFLGPCIYALRATRKRIHEELKNVDQRLVVLRFHIINPGPLERNGG